MIFQWKITKVVGQRRGQEEKKKKLTYIYVEEAGRSIAAFRGRRNVGEGGGGGRQHPRIG